MTIKDDGDIFEFLGLLDGVKDGEGTRLMVEYWRRTGRLEMLMHVLGQPNGGVFARPDELAYVIAAENIAEKLFVKLNELIAAPCCTRAPSSQRSDSSAAAAAGRLIAKLASGFGSPLRKGWYEFYSQFAKAALDISSLIDEVLRLDASGAAVRFDCNVAAADILRGAVDYNKKNGKYFVIGDRA